MARSYTIFLIFIFAAGIVSAEENKKISIAIMDFHANNTKETYAKACMDMLSEKLFVSETFTIMEKGQMDRIAQINGFKEFNTADPEQAVKLGKKLNVDKMLVGSITYLDSYTIDVKVLNAVTGEIEFNAREKISSVKKLESALDDISISIERHCLGYYNLGGNFNLLIEAHYLNPFGTFSKAVDPGPGIQAVMTLNTPFDIPFDMQAITGFCSFKPVYKSMDYFYMIPIYLAVSNKITFARNLKFIPSAGFGYIFSRISSEKSSTTDDLYWQDRSYYYNPSIIIRAELDILLFDRWYLSASPQYNIFFEEDRVGQFASLGLGLKMLF